jgi:hypothetical protein
VPNVVDIAIPASAQAAAEDLGLVVSRSVTEGMRVRRILRDEAEIAVACLQDYGFTARIVEIDQVNEPLRQVTGNRPHSDADTELQVP